jgi:hypothetical protein
VPAMCSCVKATGGAAVRWESSAAIAWVRSLMCSGRPEGAGKSPLALRRFEAVLDVDTRWGMRPPLPLVSSPARRESSCGPCDVAASHLIRNVRNDLRCPRYCRDAVDGCLTGTGFRLHPSLNNSRTHLDAQGAEHADRGEDKPVADCGRDADSRTTATLREAILGTDLLSSRALYG